MADFALTNLFDAVVSSAAARECLVQGARRFSYAEVQARSRRLAARLLELGLGAVRPRSTLERWQSGQDHVAFYLYNGPEYIEAMLGCFRARLVPCNVNYRYTEPELISLLRGAHARALVYDGGFAPMVARLREALPELRVLLQVRSAADQSLLPGALDYEAALAAADPERALPECSPDDLYILYTGGTTGSPKGVLWRQADLYVTALGGRDLQGRELVELAELSARAAQGGKRILPLPPFIHGAGHWMALRGLVSGDTVVLQEHVRSFDAVEALDSAQRERVQAMLIVGDAFGRPLLEAFAARREPLPQLEWIVNGGAPLQAELKAQLLAYLPGGGIIDSIGASESGQQATHISAAGQVRTGRFSPGPGACVLSAARDRLLDAGDPELGWLAQAGRVPLGYLDDPERTRVTFPVLDGQRYAVPGDRAHRLANGQFEVLGRDSTTINSGGEKIFAEEVEAVLKKHPAVYDVLVCARPSLRWGQEVCAVLQLRPGHEVNEAELLAHAATELARYKLPRVCAFREQIARSPSGKPDYAWAKQQFG